MQGNLYHILQKQNNSCTQSEENHALFLSPHPARFCAYAVEIRKNPLTFRCVAEYNVENTDAVPICGTALRKRVFSMKAWFAMIALLVLLLGTVPAMGDIGDPPKSPADHVPAGLYAQLEHKRQVQAVGGVTGSPYWLWQGFICGRSIDLRLFEVDHSVIATQMLFKERIRYAENGSGDKELLLTLYRDADTVELRMGVDAFAMLDRVGITTIIIRDHNLNTICTYDCGEIEAAFRYFQLEDDEYICLQGEDAPMFAHSKDNVRRAITR